MIKCEELEKILERNKTIPYPKVPKLYPNKQYCKLVYDQFGGKTGELTAITQYIYEHIELNEMKDISNILRKIAIEEMRHLDILGEIINNLGEKPIHRGANEEIWTAKNIKYDINDLKEIMKINCEAEETAIKGYRQLIRYTNNRYLRKVYERIILDEMAHLEIFKNILNA